MFLFNDIKRFLVVVALTTFPQFVLAETYDIHNKTQVEAFVDGAMKTLMEKAHSQSAVVVIRKDNEEILSKGYGYANIEMDKRIDPNTSMFRPASISKLFTWLSVMQLVEQNKLDLDVDVNQYLKHFEVAETFPGHPVTLRHIMTHTAGFEDGGAGYLIIKDKDRILPLAESMKKYQPERVYMPGERVAYSNWATSLAGLIVQNVSGEDFYDYIENHFFKPLGMHYATFREPIPDSLAENEAKPYLYKNGIYVPQSYEFISNFAPAGSSAISAGDLAKFGQMIINGGSYNGHQILKPETIQYMLHNGYVKDPRTNGMGLGFIKFSYGPDDMDNFGHTGVTTLFLSYFGVSQPENLVIFVSVTADQSILFNFVDKFYQTFFPTSLKKIESPKNFNSYAKKFVGSYVSSRSDFNHIDSFFTRALAVQSVSLIPDNSLMIKGQPYIQEKENLFRHRYKNRRIAFLENEQGEITGFVDDGHAIQEYYRARWWETSTYTYLALTLCVLTALLLFCRIGAQWKQHSRDGSAAKRAYITSLILVSTNLLFAVFLALSLTDSRAIYYNIPATLKVAVCLATFSLPVLILHLYTVILSWRGHGVVGLWSKIKHSLVSTAGLMILVFYFGWHFVGFNYY